MKKKEKKDSKDTVYKYTNTDAILSNLVSTDVDTCDGNFINSHSDGFDNQSVLYGTEVDVDDL